MKATTENQLHDFLINCRHSCKKYCVHNCALRGITITVDPPIKFGVQEGRLFLQKGVIFPSSSSVTMNFFSPIRLIFFIDPLHQKESKSLMLEVAKVLKFELFSVRSLKSWTPSFSQIFPVTPVFFKIFTTGTN